MLSATSQEAEAQSRAAQCRALNAQLASLSYGGSSGGNSKNTANTTTLRGHSKPKYQKPSASPNGADVLVLVSSTAKVHSVDGLFQA